MEYTLHDRPYRRRFRRPLKTAHGVWSVREGLAIGLSVAGTEGDRLRAIGLGEVAPLPWFGSETLAAAIAFCRAWGGRIDDRAIEAIPDALPACQFAFESARADLRRAVGVAEGADGAADRANRDDRENRDSHNNRDRRELPVCRLLPAGAAAIDALDRRLQSRRSGQSPPRSSEAIETYKWKIGTGPIAEELAILTRLRARLPPGSRLRLDANGGLDRDRARRWLEACDRFGDGADDPDDRVGRVSIPSARSGRSTHIEFLEQPLPVTEFEATCELARQFATPIALDESVASLAQIDAAHQQGWRGIVVVKPAIVGSPRRLRACCRDRQLDTVFSSVFETEVGRDAGLAIAADLQTRDRAVGYGLEGWLEPIDGSVWRFGDD